MTRPAKAGDDTVIERGRQKACGYVTNTAVFCCSDVVGTFSFCDSAVVADSATILNTRVVERAVSA